MDIAIVTGAETPLGLSLIQRLVCQGYRVHGIGNNFSKVTFADPQFFAHPVDLSNLTAVTETMAKILETEKALDLLIHAIDVTPGAAFEKLPVGNLEAILKIGLLGPVMLTRLALPNLLRFRGQLINVIPANKSGAPASAVNALLEGGLREMNRALFDGARDAGLRVTNLILRQNPEPDALSVKSSEQTHIDLEDVARAVEHLLDPNFANVPSELVLHPRTSAHSDKVLPEVPMPLDPYSEVVLPPQAYCPPAQPKIPTQERERVERTIPYTDDEMEDKIAAAIEDFEAHPERYEQPSPKQERKPRPERKQKQKQERQPRPESSQQQPQQESQPEGKQPQDKPESEQDQNRDGQDSGNNKRRRGRRRGGRNRNRDRDSNAPEQQNNQSQPEGGQPQPKSEQPQQSRDSSEGQQSKRNDSQRDNRNDSRDSQRDSPQQPRSDQGGQSSDKPKRTPRRGRSRVEPKPLLDARIETESEFLSKSDPRPQRRGRTRSESKPKAAVAEQSAPAPAPVLAPVSVSEPKPLPRVEAKESKPAAPKKKAAKKKAAKKAAAPKSEAAASSGDGETAVKKAPAKKTAAKKAAKKATKKAAKKTAAKKATKKAAKKKAVKKVSPAAE